MDTKKLLRFASFIPILALNLNLSLFGLGSQLLVPDPIEKDDLAMTILYEQAHAIDAYFAARNMPLVGYGFKMAEVAQKYNLDWRLLPAIAVQESGGGKHAIWRCKNNPFGWASCNVRFESIDQAIKVVAMNLAGGNPITEKYYKNKDSQEKLYYYNGTVISHYPQTVLAIMDKFNII
ncbi:MAG: glucosaminidase domain-containing protein [Patescibacteria group bacterium]